MTIRVFALRSLLAMILMAAPVFAQKVATTSMQFLKVMPCARATAMGDAYSVLAAGAEAPFWNPAGMAGIRGQELSTTYTLWMMETKIGALSFASSLGEIGAIGIQVQYVDYGTMEEAIWAAPYIKGDPYPGLTGRTFRPAAYVLGLTYARRLTDRFSTGLSVKYAYESLYNGQQAVAMVSQGVYEEVNTWGSGLIFDFGMSYDTGYRSVRVALAVQNFGATIPYAKESTPVPLQFRWGLAADLVGNDALFLTDSQHRLGLAFDLFQPNDYAQQFHLGMEYEFAGTVALRAGYKFNYDSESLTAGAGIRQTVGSVRLVFDYSYGRVGNFLGDVHRISVGAGLE
jgi:hypothetical protein